MHFTRMCVCACVYVCIGLYVRVVCYSNLKNCQSKVNWCPAVANEKTIHNVEVKVFVYLKLQPTWNLKLDFKYYSEAVFPYPGWQFSGGHML